MIKTKGTSTHTRAFLLLLFLLSTSNVSHIAIAGRDSKVNGRIAYVSNRDGNYEIYIINADGTVETRLTKNNYADGEPCWSPDGSKIAFTTDRDGDYEIYIMNADGSGQTRLTNNPASDGDPYFSPDGTKIAFNTDRDGNTEIYVMNIDGSGLMRRTNNNVIDAGPRWSPDGAKILYSGAPGWDWDDWEIYVMNADGSGQTRLTNSFYFDGTACYSPDGTKIAFHTDRDGNDEIYVMNADGSGQTRLTNNDSNEENPCWSPDGTKIAFDSDRDDNWNVYVMNIDGSEQTRLTNNSADDYWPIWQPLDRQSTTLTLQSSTTNTDVETSFNLDATLSAQRSGEVTLYWSKDNSGFIYKQNATMTNGKYSRSFEASTPGTWAFKVVWLGDNEYKGAESNTVTVTVTPLSVLTASATVNPTTVNSGGSSKIKINLSSEGTAVKGATLSLTSSNGGSFTTVTDLGNGTYTATYTAPDVSAKTITTVNIAATKLGYKPTSAQTELTLQPMTINIKVKEGDGTPVAGVTVASTVQPSGQTALSGVTDAGGQVTFSNVQKGAYTLKATKSGYDEKTQNLSVQQGQASTETITITKQGGIPGYPPVAIALALMLSIILYRGTQQRRSTNAKISHKNMLDE